MHLNLKFLLTHVPDPLRYIQAAPHHLLVLLYESVHILPLPDLHLILLLYPSHLFSHPLDLHC